jgi:hypothetical protein
VDKQASSADGRRTRLRAALRLEQLPLQRAARGHELLHARLRLLLARRRLVALHLNAACARLERLHIAVDL